MIKIGIDPDCIASGVAVKLDNGELMLCKNKTFFELYDFLKETKDTGHEFKVIVEAGWLNKSNWHIRRDQKTAVIAEIGERTGANHETGKKIVEMCEYLGINYEARKPRSTKVNAQLFKLITKYKGRTNQEQRDAAMLIY